MHGMSITAKEAVGYLGCERCSHEMYTIVVTLFLVWRINAVYVPLRELAKNNVCNDAYRKSLPSDLQDKIKCFEKYDDSDVKKIDANQNVCNNQICACYFEVKGATDQANIPIKNGRFKFSIVKARDICDEYNATLPTIHDPYEFTAAVDSLLNSDGCGHNKDTGTKLVALGMTKGDGDMIGSWDDNFGPANTWESTWYKSWTGNASLHAHDTFTITDGTNLFTFKQGDPTGKVQVICKQELLGHRNLPPVDLGHEIDEIPTPEDSDHGEHGKITDDHGGDRGKNTADNIDHGKIIDDHGDHGRYPVSITNGGKNPMTNVDDDKKPGVTVAPADGHANDQAKTGNGNGGGKLEWSLAMVITGLVIRHVF